MPNGTNGAMASYQWTGCLEEANTVLTDKAMWKVAEMFAALPKQ